MGLESLGTEGPARTSWVLWESEVRTEKGAVRSFSMVPEDWGLQWVDASFRQPRPQVPLNVGIQGFWQGEGTMRMCVCANLGVCISLRVSVCPLCVCL